MNTNELIVHEQWIKLHAIACAVTRAQYKYLWGGTEKIIQSRDILPINAAHLAWALGLEQHVFAIFKDNNAVVES